MLSNITSNTPEAVKDSLAGRIAYRDSVVRLFLIATVGWGVLSISLSLVANLLLSKPSLFENLRTDLQPYFTFARFNALQLNLTLFAFAANAVFVGVYYSLQRLCKVPLWSGALAFMHFIVWQVLAVALAIALMQGHTQGRAILGVAWPIEIGFAIAWILFFGLNIVMTILNRRERYLYVSLWFYMASVLTVGLLLVCNCIEVPIGDWKRVSLFAGVQDAIRQSWFTNGIASFLVTIPFLGFVYYFVPKAVDRPLFSYKLSIVHFWSIVLLTICCGSRQLHYTPIPEWSSTLGMLCGIILWMPCWAGVVNGLCTLTGSWQKVKELYALRFMIVGLVIYGFTSLESSLLSVKGLEAIVHYTDWEIAHSQAVQLGWIGFMTFGMIYWLLPRLYAMRDALSGLSQLHFWLAAVGLLLIVVPGYLGGAVQAQKWSQLSELGRLQYSFIESLEAVLPFWWVRVFGFAVYLLGLFTLGINVLSALILGASGNETNALPGLSRGNDDLESPAISSTLVGKPVLELALKIDLWSKLEWHRKLERQPVRFLLLIGSSICLLSFMQLFPILALKSPVREIASVQPYTPLELVGRDIYISQGCQNCHSQTVRPLVHESQMYGAVSEGGEFAYDRPVQWGNRRIGPDLARKGGGVQSSFWHWRHLENPPVMTPKTVMPAFSFLHESKLKFSDLGKKIAVLSELGTPYDMRLEDGQSLESKFEDQAKKQAEVIASEIIGQGGPVAHKGTLIKDTSAIALIAYIQRLGTDLSRPVVATPVP
ncbi:MAG: cbb3-type cytochrome c oxidase subunit I [Planctomycetota bacterium]|nr:cbb3-type cytochrome c oxidase subunit I [Planctomycetota bacterium]